MKKILALFLLAAVMLGCASESVPAYSSHFSSPFYCASCSLIFFSPDADAAADRIEKIEKIEEKIEKIEMSAPFGMLQRHGPRNRARTACLLPVPRDRSLNADQPVRTRGIETTGPSMRPGRVNPLQSVASVMANASRQTELRRNLAARK